MDERIGRPVNALCETQSRSDAHLLVGLVGTFGVPNLGLDVILLLVEEVLEINSSVGRIGEVERVGRTLIPTR